MNTEKIKEVFADEAFVKGLFKLGSAAEMQAALKEKGVEMTEQEILTVRELLRKVASGEISGEQMEKGELPEELLEQVAGGIGIIGVIAAIVGVFVGGTGASCGLAYALSDSDD